MSNKRNKIKGLSLKELENLLIDWGEPKYRALQIFNWIYNKYVADFDEMLNLSKELRKKFSDSMDIDSLQLTDFQTSPTTKTKKFLFCTEDDKKIEAVIIPELKRTTLCISTQVGCPLDCKFCATGLMGYKRNLNAGEIIDQYIIASRNYSDSKITNIVYMGMGEPLLNFSNTIKSLEIFTSDLSTALSRNRITVSTAGIPNKILEMAELNLRVKLALSLHSPFEEIRNIIMPINNKYSLKDNIDALRIYAKKTKTRITFEYTMLDQVNDRDEDIKALAILCKSLPSKINIIPFNSIAHMAPEGISAELKPTPLDRIIEFADELRKRDITVMIRNTQGNDIAAACGQLAIKHTT